VPVAVAALVLVLLAQRLVGDDDATAGSSGSASYGAEWVTIDGSSYRMSVEASVEELDDASPGGCIDEPASGHANLGFTVLLENLTDEAAPMPDVVFAVNATEAGQLDMSPESLAGANQTIELSPRAEGARCEEASAIHPAGREPLEPGGSTSFRGLVGGIVTPVPSGLVLIVRYVQADRANPAVASSADILVPFPQADR
jgi:hypothetical protein